MKYFILNVDKNYTAPAPTNWYGKIDRKTLETKKFHEVSRHLIFPVEENMQMVFTDIIVYPCFMVSEMIKEAVKIYDPFLKFVRVVLYDKTNKKSFSYHIPFLENINCSKSMDGNLFSINKDDLASRVIAGTVYMDKTYIIARLDLVESILRRGSIGIGVRELECR